MAGAELRVLGPLHLSVDGHDAALGTPMQRAVLGRLIVARGQVVSTERLIDDLWSGYPPPKATAVLQVHIHTLRRLFEPQRPRRAPSRFIVSESSGYALRIPENAVDAWHFEQQLRTYQELVSNPDIRTEPAERNALLEAALALWQGPALEAFAETEWAAAEADRLTDLHLTAVELNARTKLELGRPGDVVRELRQLFEDHPGREEIVRLLALAQYQLGQQLEALTTIRRSRDFLATVFGVDPTPALRELEMAILNHSATLTAAVEPGHRRIGTTSDTGAATGNPGTSSIAPADPEESTPGPGAVIVSADMAPAVGGETSATAAPTIESHSATGYTTELSELLSTAEAARGGRLRLAWVAGEAGIGKTVLAEATCSALATAGWTVAVGTCPEIDGAPTAWAWSEIRAALDGHERRAGGYPASPADEPVLDSATGSFERPAAPPLVLDSDRPGSSAPNGARDSDPNAWPTVPDASLSARAAGSGARDGSADGFVLARLIAEKCRRAARVGPVALLLEDVQRGDAATLQVLRQAVSWLRDEPVFVLVTLRRSEATQGTHNTVAALAQHTGAWVELTGLDLEGTRRTALATGLGEIDDEVLEQLHRRTGGRPLFVREVAKELAAHGNLDGVPDSIRELIEDRIAQLPDGVTEVLRQLSIWGDSVDLALLSTAAELTEDTVIDLVAAAESVGLVDSGSGGSIRFAHPLIRDAVYLSIPPLRRGRMHWAALELLETHAAVFPAVARDPDVLARHAIAGATAETAPRAIEYVERAAERRSSRGMRSASVRLLRSAVDLHRLARHDADHAPAADRIGLLRTRCALVTALAYDNRHREARAERDRALTLAEQLDDPDLETRALTCWRAPVIWAIRDWRNPDQHMRRALSRALARHGVRPAMLALLEGSATAVRGSAHAAPPGSTDSTPPGSGDRVPPAADRATGIESIGAAEMLAGRHDSTDAMDGELVLLLVTATFETGLVEYSTGHRLATLALEVARRTGDPELLCTAINAVAYLAYDYDAEFSALVDELEAVATAAGLAEYRALAQYLGYRAAVARADLREAGRRVAAAVEFADEGQLRPLLDMVSCFAATMELLRGDIDRADGLYTQFTTRTRQSGVANHAESELFCALSIGWARRELGGLLERLAAAYAALPAAAAPAYTLALLQAGQRERAREVYEDSDPIAAGFYPVLMSAFRAVAAIELGDTPAIARLYEFLSPHGGTLIGLETGLTEFGPMDSILAELAAARGDDDAAAAHRDRAERLLERIRAELPECGSALLRAA
ncbi:BTAD domain-containing putative transcriptional regulator [Nocardia sp. NPDC059240]|uniref:BTAD domain-containing putative transcriptional regulator n=1 Tax=Nocardia sp. NPDC059240 TaxID=3346786 RepID=UPI0036C85865